MAAAITASDLLRCPKNLKECIDWVLRATERDLKGQNDNIDNLKNALKAVLPSFDVNSNALTQLVQGLCLFMGYPSCLCKPKKSVEESLERISKELKEELKNYKCLLKSISKPSLNCNSCKSKNILCKCCVLDCISKVQGCDCVKGSNNNDCSCSDGDPKRCCKDLLEKLKASLSLLNLRADMEKLCTCPDDCCVDGVCTGGSSNCPVCDNLKTSKDYTVTGMGLLRPSPKRLAERLNEFFGDKASKGSSGCTCKCGSGQGVSCCCLACETGNCSQFCNSECRSKGSCLHKSPSDCPRQKFCLAIDSIKIPADSKERTCCKGGEQCHCELDGSGSGTKCQATSSSSNLKCCIERSGQNYKHSVKCMIRRLVKFFCGLGSPSGNFFKSCCDLLCVAKTCYFLWDFYQNKGKEGGKEKCSKCTSTGKPCPGSTLKSPPPSTVQCCNGKFESCSKSNCCLGCQDCDAIKFRKALQTLKLSSPCGQDLWRVLNDFLDCCFRIFKPEQKFVEEKVKALQKSCQKGSKTPKCCQAGKSCDCSSGSSYSCLACFALFNDYELKARFISEYSSSYTYKFLSSFDTHINATSASWKYLCRKPSPPSPSTCCCGLSSCPQCLSSSSCCQSQSSCDPSKCCPDCPQRKAAKIFLGMLPCLYYGLKIVFDRAQDPVTWPDWQNISVSDGNPSSGLAKFLQAWGYDVRPLISKKGSEFPCMLENLFGGSLNSLYENCKIYFTSFSSRSLLPSSNSKPETVRSMLLWLYGLRFQKHFSELVENSKSLCLPFGNSFHPDAFCYYVHTCCFILPVAIISFIEDSDSAQKVFSSSSPEWQNFSYPEDPFKLFETFCDFVRKIYIALTFLKFQCERGRDQAGWQYCWYGKNCKVEPLDCGPKSTSPSCSSCKYSGAYLCTGQPYGTDDAHDHCSGSFSGKGCIGFDSSGSTPCNGTSGHKSDICKPCPHPLQRFLCHSDSNSKDYPFGLSGIVPMGFSKENLSSTARDGWSLYHVLKAFCQDGFYPLTRLVQFILCISQRPPETLGELYAFFMKFVESSVFRDHFASYVDGEPGRFLGNSLKGAVQGLYGAKDSHKGSGGSSHQDPSKTPADLKSLYDCHPKKDSEATCGKYLYSLTENAYKDFIQDFLDTYLSFVCYLGPKFKKELERFNSEAREKSLKCCLEKSCENIVSCPCALPFLYKSGFTFWSPKGLNCESHGSGKEHSGQAKDCTRRTCKNFIDQLEKVFGEHSPLQTLLTVIDNFLWHIRLPFVYTFLYIWILVISYFYYVQFYKLDLLHLKSHAHLSRSFKILPSTLFSDASSKLKDLSYFTL